MIIIIITTVLLLGCDILKYNGVITAIVCKCNCPMDSVFMTIKVEK